MYLCILSIIGHWAGFEIVSIVHSSKVNQETPPPLQSCTSLPLSSPYQFSITLLKVLPCSPTSCFCLLSLYIFGLHFKRKVTTYFGDLRRDVDMLQKWNLICILKCVRVFWSLMWFRALDSTATTQQVVSSSWVKQMVYCSIVLVSATTGGQNLVRQQGRVSQ